MPSRRADIAMTPEEVRAYVRAQPRLILTSNGHDGYPHPMPMNFVVDDEDRFVMTTYRKSQKVANFQRDPRASLLVESGNDYSDIKSVLAYAKAEIIDDPELVKSTMDALTRKLAGPNASEKLLAEGQATAPKRVVIRFAPEHIISWDHSKLGGRY